MEYLSTRNNQIKESFTNVLFQGLSKEGGLFVPVKWPSIDINTLRDKSYEEVALHIISPFIGDEIQKEDNGLVWIILEDGNFNDLVSSIYTIGNAISSNGGSENLVAAIFEIYLSVDIDDNSTRRGVRSYCIYRYDRKSFYPFIPTGENEGERDKTAESVLGRDLSNSGLIIEKDFSQWMGLWGIPF